MFRLTIDGASVAAWRAARPGARITKMRVYKWGDNVGLYLCGAKWDSAWIPEQRVPLAHGHGFLLEKITHIPMCDAPPPTVDDIWTEDVIIQGNIIAGNCLTIVGNAKTICDFITRTGVKLSSDVNTMLLTQDESQRVAQELQPVQRAEGVEDMLDTTLQAPRPLRSSQGTKGPLQRPPPPHLLSSRDPSTHLVPRVPQTEGPRRPVGAPMRDPRRVHTGLRPYERRAELGPTSRDRFRQEPARPRPVQEHGVTSRPHYVQHRTGRLPRAQGCLVVEE